MAVYVDDMKAPYGRMVMCHMMADTTAELLEMADKIGVARRWIQKAGQPGEHFDVALVSRARAVKAGAQEVTMRFCAKLMMDRHKLLKPAAPVTPLPTPTPAQDGGDKGEK